MQVENSPSIDDPYGDPYSRFEYGIKSEETRKKYVRRLELFFNFCHFKGKTIREKARNFVRFIKENGVERTTDLILKYMSYHVNRAQKKEISKSTIRNFYKPIKLFGEMNNIILNWKIISKGIPFPTNSNDRIPTREEILDMLKYPDRRLKAITYTMISSGIRVGAWEYLRWKHITPIYDSNNKVIAAKILVYDGEPERYFSFITPEAYYALKEWMDFRSSQGEKITSESWLMRDLWDTGHIMIESKESNLTKGTSGLVSSPKKSDADSIRQIFTRAWRIQNIRSFTLDMKSKRRHEFKATHCFRKYCETHALNNMKLLNVKMLMGHDTGLEKSYYKPSEKDLLDDYLRAVDSLTINNEAKIQLEIKELTEKQDEILLMKLRHEKEMKQMREDMELKFNKILAKVDVAKLKR